MIWSSIPFNTYPFSGCITPFKPVFVSQPTSFRRRFNQRNANWFGYVTDVDNLIGELRYWRELREFFVKAIRVLSKKHIPMGYRNHYIPGLSEESKSIYELAGSST